MRRKLIPNTVRSLRSANVIETSLATTLSRTCHLLTKDSTMFCSVILDY